RQSGTWRPRSRWRCVLISCTTTGRNVRYFAKIFSLQNHKDHKNNCAACAVLWLILCAGFAALFRRFHHFLFLWQEILRAKFQSLESVLQNSMKRVGSAIVGAVYDRAMFLESTKCARS